MAFLIAPILAGLAGMFAGSALAPKQPKMPKPTPPPDAPIRPSETAAAERARRALPRSGGGLAGMILTPLGGSSSPSAPKSMLGR